MSFKKEVGERRNLKIPGGIKFVIQGNDVVMHISSFAVGQNMQEDKASFEGWALVLKRWGNFTNVILSWENPTLETGSPHEGHYHRFLFRVDCFSNHFKSWFVIDQSSQALMSEMKIRGADSFYLNKPSKNRNVSLPHGKNALNIQCAPVQIDHL
ncbi:MAG: hypothetical protein WCJ02_16985, partial [bacterium]